MSRARPRQSGQRRSCPRRATRPHRSGRWAVLMAIELNDIESTLGSMACEQLDTLPRHCGLMHAVGHARLQRRRECVPSEWPSIKSSSMVGALAEHAADTAHSVCACCTDHCSTPAAIATFAVSDFGGGCHFYQSLDTSLTAAYCKAESVSSRDPKSV